MIKSGGDHSRRLKKADARGRCYLDASLVSDGLGELVVEAAGDVSFQLSHRLSAGLPWLSLRSR